MITYTKAKQVLDEGDVVFALDENWGVEEAIVRKIQADSLLTDKGFLDFFLHGDT